MSTNRRDGTLGRPGRKSLSYFSGQGLPSLAFGPSAPLQAPSGRPPHACPDYTELGAAGEPETTIVVAVLGNQTAPAGRPQVPHVAEPAAAAQDSAAA